MANETVLILEDDLTELNLLSKQLTAAGYQVIPVVEGRMAIETCLDRKPDIVLTDLRMPGFNGYEFIRQLRRKKFTAPVVVISALDINEKTLPAGANAYLPKPVDRELLLSTVEKEIVAGRARAHGTRKHIMVLEDEPLMLRLLRADLEPAGFRVTSVENGTAALEIVENDPPDLVVSDLVVPGIDGLQLITKLRQEHNYRAPILVVSGHADEKHRQAAKDAGADGFLAKPVGRPELLARVKELLSRGT
jgi:DNA-binding response OmpR family regulator